MAKVKPPATGKQIDYFDAGMPGLVLRVNYGGAKVWRALYYGYSGDGGQAFHLKADSDSGRSRTAFR